MTAKKPSFAYRLIGDPFSKPPTHASSRPPVSFFSSTSLIPNHTRSALNSFPNSSHSPAHNTPRICTHALSLSVFASLSFVFSTTPAAAVTQRAGDTIYPPTQLLSRGLWRHSCRRRRRDVCLRARSGRAEREREKCRVCCCGSPFSCTSASI